MLIAQFLGVGIYNTKVALRSQCVINKIKSVFFYILPLQIREVNFPRSRCYTLFVLIGGALLPQAKPNPLIMIACFTATMTGSCTPYKANTFRLCSKVCFYPSLHFCGIDPLKCKRGLTPLTMVAIL